MVRNAVTRLGVSVKMITGDNRLVKTHASTQVGLSNPQLLSGTDLRSMSDEALRGRVNEGDVFALTPLGLWYLTAIGAAIALYIVTAELTKRAFYRL